MTEKTELVALPPKETALQVYSTENGLEPFLAQIREEIDGFIPDVTTRKGREAIASIAHKVARSKTALDDVGKQLVADLKEVPKKIDAERKRMRDMLDAWKEEVRKPLTDWEQAEADRVAAHQASIEHLRNTNTDGATAAMIQALITDLEQEEVGQEYEEYEAEAHRVKAASLETLRAALSVRQRYEAEQEELAELRRKQAEQEQKDREARIAAEAAEKASREAEQRAQAERDAAAQRERDLELQAERAQREKLEAEQRAQQAEREAADRAERAAQAERQRVADEQAEAERVARAREADVANKTAVLTAIKEAFMKAGVTEEQAKAVTNMIRKGEVPGVSITY